MTQDPEAVIADLQARLLAVKQVRDQWAGACDKIPGVLMRSCDAVGQLDKALTGDMSEE